MSLMHEINMILLFNKYWVGYFYITVQNIFLYHSVYHSEKIILNDIKNIWLLFCLVLDIPTNIYQGLISKSDAYRSFFLVRWVHSKLENLAKLAENGNIYVKFATR